MNIFMKPDRSRFANVKAIAATEKKKTDRVVPPNASGPRKPAGKGTDADIEKLQASIAQANAEKLGNSYGGPRKHWMLLTGLTRVVY